MGVLIGLLSIRLGNLYVALVTLTFGLLMEKLVFTRDTFAQSGVDIAWHGPASPPLTASSRTSRLGVFCVIALVIVNLRRSTTGLALGAVDGARRVRARWGSASSR